jgi:NAD(P)H dehydrogenase (quinone)
MPPGPTRASRPSMRLVLTGASGHLGRRTAELILAHVDPASVVLVSRRPESLADLQARGATIRLGDFDDPDSLLDAFAGANRLLLISTDAFGRRVTQHGHVISAARRVGVQHVIYTSLPDPSESNPALVAADHGATEALLRDSGLAWTILRNALYSDHLLPRAVAAIGSGRFSHNDGTGASAYVSREDCAAVAAAVLGGGREHAGETYDVTGPELLDADGLARCFAELGGVPVGADELTDEALVAEMIATGLPAPVAKLLASFGAAIRGGHLAQLSPSVKALTGHEPVPVVDVLTATGVISQAVTRRM